MALIRKKDLSRYQEINKLIKNDIGESTTVDSPHTYEDEQKEDKEWDDIYNLSNVVNNGYDMGNLGEYYGDMIDQKYSNLLFIRNPLKTNLSSFEEFGTMYMWGDFWKQRSPSKVQKFDKPDKELNENNSMIKENSQYKEKSDKDIKPTKRLKRFSDF